MDEHEHAPAAPAPAIADLDLGNTIEEALWSLDSVRVSKPAIVVIVDGGRGTLSGTVSSPMMREEIEAALSGLPVTIALLDDAAIEYAAAYALAMDSRTAPIPPGYQVSSYNGHVHIRGRLTPEQAQAVQQVARVVNGVWSVKVHSPAHLD
jgi:osmotically-inducible protein OsmY